jgi:hypothetical protein
MKSKSDLNPIIRWMLISHRGEEGLTHHLTKTGTLEQGMGGNIAARGESSTESYNNKPNEVSPV